MNEIERRQVKWQSVLQAWQRDPTLARQRADLVAHRPERAVEALTLLDHLRDTRDIETFRKELQAWSQLPGYESFRGFGMMFVHQVVQTTDDPIASAELFIDALTAPRSEDEAAQKTRPVVTHIERIKQGGQPAPRRVPFVLSLFWSMVDSDRWPCLWQSAGRILTALGWLTPPGDRPRSRSTGQQAASLGTTLVSRVRCERTPVDLRDHFEILDRCEILRIASVNRQLARHRNRSAHRVERARL